jgi:hypothetical protein
MKLQLEWGRPILLRDAGREENLLYTFDYSKLPEVAGVYVLGRRYSRKFEALYVGKAGAIRGRARGQLKNLPLMFALEESQKWPADHPRRAIHLQARTARGKMSGTSRASPDPLFPLRGTRSCQQAGCSPAKTRNYIKKA